MDTKEKITLFWVLLQGVCCRDFNISLPKKIQGLSGSCVIIDCRFDIQEQYDTKLTIKAVGKWIKDNINSNLVFSSDTSMQNSFVKANITGKLKDKDCTTVFYDIRSNHNGQYFFRIEGEDTLKWTFKNTVSVHVIESPLKPRVQLYEEQKELQDQLVLEGRSVSLRCSAEALCSSLPATLTWSSTPGILLSENSKLQKLIISDLNFTAAPHHHNVTFTCSISYRLHDNNKTAHSSITLNVQYSPKNMSVSVLPSDSVLEGSSVNLTCSCEANPVVLNYNWSRESKGQREILQTGDTFTILKTELSHRGLYICSAQNKHGIQEKSVLLDIQYAPQISNFSNCTGIEARVCFCEFHGSPSPKVQWLLSGNPVYNSSDTVIGEQSLSTTSLRSSISIHKSLTQTITLQCVGKNTHGYAEKQFNVVFGSQNKWLNGYSLMVGVVLGSLFVAILWAATMLLKKKNRTQSGDESALIQTDGEINSVNSRVLNKECLYANKVLTPSAEAATQNHSEQFHYSTINFMKSNEIRGLSSLTTEYGVIQHCGQNVTDKVKKTREVSLVPNLMIPLAKTATQNHPEELHYSTIQFMNTKAESSDIRGVSSLTTEYAVIQHCGQNVTDKETKATEVSSVPSEDPVYQVPHKTLIQNNECK